MRDAVCPVDVLAEARKLVSRVAGEDLPLTYDPGELDWDQNLLRIVREHTNYDDLVQELEGWIVENLEESGIHCERWSAVAEQEPEQRCANCSYHWVAGHELSQAAYEAAERLYQRWLARRALADRRAGRR